MGTRIEGADPVFGGNWTEQKLGILEAYLESYTTALKNSGFQLVYIDAFAGSGGILPGSGGDRALWHDARSLIMGSAARALAIDDRPFDRLVFVERDHDRCVELRRLRDQHHDRAIEILENDANLFLRSLNQSEYGNWRGVLFVDPFGVQLEWATVEHVASLQRLDTWLLFPVGAIGRMLPLSRNPEDVEPSWAERLDVVFGDDRWRNLYSRSPQEDLFGDPAIERAPGVNGLLATYKDQLSATFGSCFLQESRTLRNSRNAPLFEFIFCAGHPKGAVIAKKISRHLIEGM